MRLIWKLMFAVLVIALAAPFYLPGADGRPLLTLDRLVGEELSLSGLAWPEWAALGEASPTTSKPATTRTAYKWRDADGVWHYSDRPPPEAAVEVVRVRSDTNVVPATDAHAADYGAEASEPGAAGGSNPAEGASGESGDPAVSLSEPLERARRARDAMDARQRELRSRIEGAAE